jgi:hypothetical protein
VIPGRILGRYREELHEIVPLLVFFFFLFSAFLYDFPSHARARREERRGRESGERERALEVVATVGGTRGERGVVVYERFGAGVGGERRVEDE